MLDVFGPNISTVSAYYCSPLSSPLLKTRAAARAALPEQ